MVKNKFVLISLCFSILILIFSSCNNGTHSNKEQGASLEVSYENFKKEYEKNSDIKILDVRTPEEYQQAHVPKAILFPLNKLLQSKTDGIPFSKKDTIYVICRSGRRSLTAANTLKSLGYKKAVSIKGGTKKWVEMGNPVVKERIEK